MERLRSRQPNSSQEMLVHQALHMTREDRRRQAGHGSATDASSTPTNARDLWDEWRRITHPTLIVRGRQSDLLTHEVAVRMREAVPRARLAELEGGGHWFYQEQRARSRQRYGGSWGSLLRSPELGISGVDTRRKRRLLS